MSASNDFSGHCWGASLVIVTLGVLDDRFCIRGRQKLVGQFVAALVMLPSGILIEKVQMFGVTVEFGDLSAIVTLFWIMGAINALNLIDGVDYWRARRGSC